MNRAQLIDAVSADIGVNKDIVGKTLESFLRAITQSLAEGKPVSLLGFGTFMAKLRSARMGRNPKTGAELQIAESTVPAFKPGKLLKDAVNRETAEVSS